MSSPSFLSVLHKQTFLIVVFMFSLVFGKFSITYANDDPVPSANKSNTCLRVKIIESIASFLQYLQTNSIAFKSLDKSENMYASMSLKYESFMWYCGR